MDLHQIASMIGLGLAAGVVGGMFGIGGGLIMVPALILIFGFETKLAFGTSLLAQLLPVGLLGVREYWLRSQLDLGSGLWIALGLLFGAWLGGYLTGIIPREPMKQGYGIFLVAVGLYFLFAPGTPTGPAGRAAVADRPAQVEAEAKVPSEAGPDQAH